MTDLPVDDKVREAVEHLRSIAADTDYHHGSTWHRALAVFGSNLGSSEDALDTLTTTLTDQAAEIARLTAKVEAGDRLADVVNEVCPCCSDEFYDIVANSRLGKALAAYRQIRGGAE